MNRVIWNLVLVVVAAVSLRGTPLAARSPEAADQPSLIPGRSAAAGLLLPDIGGSAPWSDKPAFSDPSRFRIAIVSDRTGGHRPGIWMKAVERLNLMRPDFVVSVGDLIEGYTDDVDTLQSQWGEFLSFIDKMSMRFFFVAGNHDLSNPTMHKIWKGHFGREWYSFDYKGVHFVCLCSEDPVAHIGEQQLGWLDDDLRQSMDARWTLVFLHQPLWSYAARKMAAGEPDTTNWTKVEAMLGSRSRTVFAGHTHHYLQYDRNGMKYFNLATTGAASPLRGAPYGEFDHIAWLTMEPDGPFVTNLKLDGILPPDVVTEESAAEFRGFLTKTPLDIAPILVDRDMGISTTTLSLCLTNRFDRKVTVAGRIEGLPMRGLTLEPPAPSLTSDPGGSDRLAVRVAFTETVPFSELSNVQFKGRIRTVNDPARLVAERTVPILIARKYDCPRRSGPVVVDAGLDEWPSLPFSTGSKPLVLAGAEEWTGPSDAEVRFAVAYNDEFLYLAAHVTDDAVVTADDDKQATDDRLELVLDARPINQRIREHRYRRGAFVFDIAPPAEGGESRLAVRAHQKAPIPPGTQHAASRTDDGYNVELVIPIGFITQYQKNDWQGFQFTAVAYDTDKAGRKPCRIVWRGTKDVSGRNTNLGQFVRTR